jgi:Tol biopolymer transport system component
MMNRKTSSQILDSLARDHLHANVDLAPHILARVQKGKDKTMQPRVKVFAIAFFLLLVFMIVLVKVPSVAATIQRWFGYVPGIGLVSEGQIHVLAEPVSATRDGITLRVDRVLVDSNQTTLVYSVDGLLPDMLDSSPVWNTPGCYEDAVLRLPADELLPTGQIGTSWGAGYEHQMTYPAIPSGIEEVTFVMPCVRSAIPGRAPENWELSFRLVPAQPELTAFPVIEISTPVEVQATEAIPPQAATSAALSTDGIFITMDRAVQMDDGYLIYVTLHWENSRFSSVDRNDADTIHLVDANGQEVAYTYDLYAMKDMARQVGQTTFAIKTAPILVPGPLTLILDSVVVAAAVPLDASFTFDPGPDPKPGQVWEINQDVDLGYGYSLRVLRATYSLLNGTQAALNFELESKTGVTSAMLFDREHPVAGAGGGAPGVSSKSFTAGFSYQGALPEGPVTIQAETFYTTLPGRWQAKWTPPEIQAGITPAPQGPACLTRKSWQQALQQAAPLPAGLNGTLAIFDLVPPTNNYGVSVANLDGGERKSVGLGSAPTLSPDGTRVAYQGPAIDSPADGVYITDLASGNTTRLPGTTRGDMNPLWSPDGQKIVFTRGPSSGLIGAPGPYNIYVTDVDGSNFRQLTDGVGTNYAMTWWPDGIGILYTVVSRDVVSLRIMNIQTGENRLLFDMNYYGTIAVSPDGNRLAFEEKLPLDKYGLFVSNSDGSNRKLLADGDPYIATIPVWSPDGKWVLASVHDPDANKGPNPTLALIEVDTCQIIPLPYLTGYATSWLP